MTTHATNGVRRCAQSHYAAVVEATKDAEIYQLGDLDCESCLRSMVDRHAAIAATFQARLGRVTGAATSAPRALCHGCLEMVDVADGKLAPHHGDSGDGCALNGSVAQIYLHPRVADRIADLEAALVFGPRGGRP